MWHAHDFEWFLFFFFDFTIFSHDFFSLNSFPLFFIPEFFLCSPPTIFFLLKLPCLISNTSLLHLSLSRKKNYISSTIPLSQPKSYFISSLCNHYYWHNTFSLINRPQQISINFLDCRICVFVNHLLLTLIFILLWSQLFRILQWISSNMGFLKTRYFELRKKTKKKNLLN